MPCYHPIQAYQLVPLGIPSGPLLFSKPTAQASIPLKTPCRNCIGCRISRSTEWALRIQMESKKYANNSFITLTFSDEHLPQYGSLNKKTLQDFVQNLRNYATKTHGKDHKIRFYNVGEYGDQLGRPHFHCCIFNLAFPDLNCIGDKQGVKLYESQILEEIWGLGLCSVGDVTYQSAAYVARYIMAKITGDLADQHYQTTDESTGDIIQLEPEFNSMSKHPGIGADWFEQFNTDLYPGDFALQDGRKMPVPKYFDKLLERIDPEAHAVIKEARKESSQLRKKDNTPARLVVREKVKSLKLRQLQRNL